MRFKLKHSSYFRLDINCFVTTLKSCYYPVENLLLDFPLTNDLAKP
jgi:hypothetical protein